MCQVTQPQSSIHSSRPDWLTHTRGRRQRTATHAKERMKSRPRIRSEERNARARETGPSQAILGQVGRRPFFDQKQEKKKNGGKAQVSRRGRRWWL